MGMTPTCEKKMPEAKPASCHCLDVEEACGVVHNATLETSMPFAFCRWQDVKQLPVRICVSLLGVCIRCATVECFQEEPKFGFLLVQHKLVH